MMMGQAIGAVVQAAAVANHEEPGDYTGEDGLLYCGKCHTPKQVRIASVFLKRDAPLPCMCKCKSEAWDREKQNKARLEHYERAVSSQLVRIDNRSVREWTFERDDGKNQDISSLARKYVDDWKLYRDKGQGLLLWGNVGTGKSYMAACISNALRERQIPTLFTSFGAIIKSVSNFDIDKNQFFRDFGKFDLIVLDDLGAERNSAFALEQVFDVIDSRVQSGLPMIVTTNLTVSELKHPESRSYQRIYDRLLQVCTPVNFCGHSRRKVQAEQNVKEMKSRMRA